MPAYLKRDEDAGVLTIRLADMRGSEFSEALARVKSIPGRRFNPEDKTWELPDDAATALRAMQMLECVPSADVQRMVRAHSAEIAEALVTKLPEDADLEFEGSDVLRPYQRSAVSFFQEHPHSILADEMGTGKTLQSLATYLEALHRAFLGQSSPLLGPEDNRQLYFDAPVAIVCPKGLIGNWAGEIEKWVPNPGEIQVIDGKTPTTRKQQAQRNYRWLIVNWEKLRLMPELAKIQYAAVFADEAHRAKNRKAQQTKALWKLKAPIQLAITGTPVMNSPDELWSLLRWIRPEQYTGFWPFHYSYVDEYQTRHGAVMTGVKNPDQLRFELADKMVRRTKKQVLPELPDKTVQVILVDFDAPTRKLYQEVENAFLLDITAWLETQEEYDLDDLEGMPLDKLKGLVPNAGARITKLRQITSAFKVRTAEEMIRDEAETPQVAFCWYVDSAKELHERLSKGKPKLKVGRIAGNDDPTPVKDAFQAADLDHVVATIAKGGVGLDLYRSSTCIFVDEDWVPDINTQAEDRLHRMGQKNAVNSIRLRVRDTIDVSKVATAHRFKELIAAQVLGVPTEQESE